MLLGYNTKYLETHHGIHTAREILQQPALWRETAAVMNQFYEKRKRFKEMISEEKDTRVILTGAGSSAFAGQMLAPFLTRFLKRQVEAIATTDLVTHPENYLLPDKPTVLISFARSGDSPESAAAVALARQIINKLYNVVITCNETGELAIISRSNPDDLVLLMPEAANDKGFAMTSSLTCMMIACLKLFLSEKSEIESWIEKASICGERFLNNHAGDISELANSPLNRIVFLGSSAMKAAARESALKNLELTAGQIAAFYDSGLGFRHGPKSIINENTMIVLFMDDGNYPRKYELDVIKEIADNRVSQKVIVLSGSEDPAAEKHAHMFINMETKGLPDVISGIVYLLFSQVLALALSFKLNITPDNPNPEGLVNRVVKGVTIYSYEANNFHRGI